MPKRKDKDQSLAPAAVAGGGLALSKVKGSEITGRTTLYHGTAPRNREKILREGILSKYTGGENTNTEILKRVNPKVYEESLGKVYLTPDKEQAKIYAAQGELGGMQAVRNNRAEFKVRQLARGEVGEKGTIKASVPLWKMDTVLNPELKVAVNPSLFAKDKVIKGDLSPEYLKGSKHYKRVGLREIGQYAKARPKEFARGVGKLGAGVALVGSGLYSIGKTKERKKTASILKALLKAKGV